MTSRNPNGFNPLNIINRRGFAKAAGGCAALGSTSILSTLLNLKMQKALMANQPVNDYKALVCLFLYGGNDSFNMLAPYEQTEYDKYAQIRTNLAVPRASMLPITGTAGRQFGMHPNLTDLHDLYTSGKLAFMANVGSLVEPVTPSNYYLKRLPEGLYSHSDLTQHWMTNVPQNRTQTTGWGGRMADVLTDDGVNASSLVSMSLALGGLNIFENGNSTIPYVVGTNGASVLEGYDVDWHPDRIYTKFLDSSLAAQYSDVLEMSYSKTRRLSIDAAVTFNNATNVTLNTQFPTSWLGQQLQMVAKTIAARDALEHQRQIFFVTMWGYDNHDEVIINHGNLMQDVNDSLKAFYDATTELDVTNNVTTFSASDFGRTLNSNGNGSDHGWGGNQFVMGGAVSGGQVYGEYPISLLGSENPLDLGRGRLIPTLSVDEYSCEIAKWFGIPASDMEYVLPNITEFYDPYSSELPVGFMAGPGGGNGNGNV